MTPKDYARALFESVLAHPENLSRYVKNLKNKLAAEGKKERLRDIEREVNKLIAKKKNRESVILSVAHEKDLPLARKTLQASPLATPYKENIQELVRPHLVGGLLIETWNARIDGSYQRKLLDLYDSLTK